MKKYQNPVKYIFIFLFLIALLNCAFMWSDSTLQKEKPLKMVANPIDSLKALVFDTSSLQGKAKRIVRDFNIYNYQTNLNFCDKDTLQDLNFDGFEDLVIYFHYLSGSCKNAMEVHLYDQKLKIFIRDVQLSSISNPYIDLKNNQITGYCIGNGSNSGDIVKLVWQSNKWDSLKYVTFETKDVKTWKVETVAYPSKIKKITYCSDIDSLIDKL